VHLPFGALSSDIECLALQFVVAGALVAVLPDTRLNHSKTGFSTTPSRDDCGNLFSQHLSFGATIRLCRDAP